MSDFDADTLAQLHRSSFRNRCRLQAAGRIACFGCLGEFEAKQVREYVDAGETALCPDCGLDTLIAVHGADAADTALLRALNERYLQQP